MITLDIKSFGKETGISDYVSKLSPFITSIKSKPQGFHSIEDDQIMVREIEQKISSHGGEYQSIVVLGIGGSALGIKCIIQAIMSSDGPKMQVVDNIDPDQISRVIDSCDFKTTLFIVISKSGKTVETQALYALFVERVNNSGLSLKDHFIFITGVDGPLRQQGEANNIPMMLIPENIGGRFSVLSPVGLLPAALMGVNIRDMLEGAQEMRDLFLNNKFDQNLPFQLAAAMYEMWKMGKTSNVFMPYSMRLKGLVDWYVQLVAESTGKKDVNGKSVGITPIAAMGVTDQHSQLQLFMDGPDDKSYLFLEVDHNDSDPEIPQSIEAYSFLKGRKLSHLFQAECKATQKALQEQGRIAFLINVDRVDPKTLGGLFMLFEGTVAFLGEFLNVNVFDQPGVERGKELMPEFMEQE